MCTNGKRKQRFVFYSRDLVKTWFFISGLYLYMDQRNLWRDHVRHILLAEAKKLCSHKTRQAF